MEIWKLLKARAKFSVMLTEFKEAAVETQAGRRRRTSRTRGSGVNLRSFIEISSLQIYFLIAISNQRYQCFHPRDGKALEALCIHVVAPLQELINQGPLVLGQKPAREITVHIYRLANIFRYVNNPEAVADAIQRLWPLLKPSLIFVLGTCGQWNHSVGLVNMLVPQRESEVHLTLGGIDLNNSGS
ncbi:hypothetical protein L1987_49920 [Smallanthus sonchifolius]|uniref:Uncharacterized protein n=1 Tax=Smallanthus sonchifolius TaxID=185202 RepID=A0ACB9FWL2_9ASTR|nr:hypothetical protein L1987_49920 [Smallanthus sonchifolius]